MKKIWLLTLFLLGLFLYWCWEVNENTNVDKVTNEENIVKTDKIEEENTVKNAMSESEIFENNLKCQEYVNSYEEWSKHIASPAEPLWITVFYSPIENSCMGYFSTQLTNWLSPYDQNYEKYTEYYITSAFDKSHDWSLYTHNTDNKWSQLNKSKKTWCDWVSAFGMPSNEAWFLFDEDCDNIEELRWEEINYLKWN